jgi:hypothetical protein
MEWWEIGILRKNDDILIVIPVKATDLKIDLIPQYPVFQHSIIPMPLIAVNYGKSNDL